MQTFVWGEDFYTGIAEVDAQHHGLVDLINRLGDTTVENVGLGEPTIELVFKQLTDYAKYHFLAEEAIMRRVGVDQRHVVYHLKAHSDFNENLQAMWNSRAALNNPAEVFHAFLTSWLCLHVLGTDQAMARQAGLIDRGETPEQAFENDQLRPRDRGVEIMIKALRNTFQVLSRLSLDLISVNRSLDERVAARTADLERANELLVVANQKLEVYSQTDGLLRIANRKYFDSRLSDEWNRAIRERYSIGLLMIDVDFFKNYNDHYGHLAGDTCLQAVAKAASSKMVRAIDLLARFGGEEFVVMLPSTDLEGAHKVASGICEAVSRLSIPHAASSVANHVTVSVGVTSILPDRQSTTDLAVAAADQALYSAKQQGRNRVCRA
jgi:diguanylate cyclase (GGDEF)-like protein/hemerythrin-like metal-binding protein